MWKSFSSRFAMWLLPLLITFQFEALVVSISDSAQRCFHVEYTPHLALKGLKATLRLPGIYHNDKIRVKESKFLIFFYFYYFFKKVCYICWWCKYACKRTIWCPASDWTSSAVTWSRYMVRENDFHIHILMLILYKKIYCGIVVYC